jgi:hypothetical protein
MRKGERSLHPGRPHRNPHPAPPMPDIRLVRPRNSRLRLWTGLLFVAAMLAAAAPFIFGDATTRKPPAVGAGANFGADRAPVLPLRTERFEEVLPLQDRELGRLVHLTGVAETGASKNAVWVRAPGGHRILVRFEPKAEAAALRRFYPGAAVSVDGYVEKIALAEFHAWMDSLDVYLPRPKPGVKFGDLPDSTFAALDALFIKGYYLSVRPSGIGADEAPPPLRPVRDSASRDSLRRARAEAAGAAAVAAADSARAAASAGTAGDSTAGSTRP